MGMIKPFQQTLKDGQKVDIRAAAAPDAASLLQYGQTILAEDVYSLITLEEFTFTLQDEEKFILSHFEREGALIILAVLGDLIIGMINFENGHRKRIAHTGQFGMSVHRDFRRLGLGEALLGALIAWAEASPLIETVILRVHGTNTRARKLYSKMGFQFAGVIKNELKYGPGNYVDGVTMSLDVSGMSAP